MVKIEDVVVVELQGEVWGGWDSVELKDSVDRLLKTGEAIRNINGKMALCEVNERARRAFSISEVWNEFDSKASRAEGLKSLGVSESNP